MLRIFPKASHIKKKEIILTKEELHHLKTVTRTKVGDHIEVVFDKDTVKKVKVEKIEKETLYFSIVKTYHIKKQTTPKITLIQCLPKQDKFDEILKKCTELNVDHFVPVTSNRTISKPKDDNKKYQRWQKTLLNACMQTKRTESPTLSPIMSLKEASEKIESDLKIVCWEEATQTHLKTILTNNPIATHIQIVIGPEGGLTKEEIKVLEKNGFIIAKIADTILRVENAAFLVAGNIHYHYTKESI